MYERIGTRRRTKGELPLCLGVGLCVLLLLAVLIPIVWSGHYQWRYWGYFSDLSDSTTYAYRHGSLQVQRPEGSTLAEGAELIYGPYQLVVGAGRGRAVEPPDAPPDVLLTYGDGSTLALWRTRLTGYQDTLREYGLLLHYVNQEGRSFTYDTDKLTLEAMELVLPPVGDPPAGG